MSYFFIYYFAYIFKFSVVCLVIDVLYMCLIHVKGIKINNNNKINKKKKIRHEENNNIPENKNKEKT